MALRRHGLEHRAFLYSGVENFLSTTVPFLVKGLEADDAVVAVVRRPNLDALRDVLGPDGDVGFYDSAEFYDHPVRTLKRYLELVDGMRPRRVVALAEPVWHWTDQRQTLEWARYESLINKVFADSGARALCPYDRDGLSSAVLDFARHTHPVLFDGRIDHENDRYMDPQVFGAGCDVGRRFEGRPDTAEYMAVHDEDLHPLRVFVGKHAEAHGLDRQQAQNLVTAANEVAANALQHGVPPMGVWVWRDGDELVCEVGDNGFWQPSPLIGFIPPESARERGFGLWTVRLLVDLMELRAGWDGTFVRLHVSR
ncbi:sensor histidine kinase [Actinomadura kijaniata]|uniref:Anti-sigma regulatory factor (Ser/Thr protein kinase) n=1 Tax=Actinomadura namibiensis TaxID=182080 RepID=A0A7W3QL95_ACTNM|nr:sensor histidine kinase [Actinomadura namibiensis]MBA8951280.1 anti-sigma regulatory factor (Ser/Thr protein kinase) [Actinomadura namibiensis]